MAEEPNKGMHCTNLSCCGSAPSIPSEDLNKVVKLRAGVIISQDSDLHLQEKPSQ
jgi:hypothetical protein